MGADVDAPSRRTGNGIPEAGIIVSAVDELERLIVNRLETVFDQDKMLPGKRFEQSNFSLIDAIRPGTDVDDTRPNSSGTPSVL